MDKTLRGNPAKAAVAGRAMFTIIGAMAELESSLISERVAAGMRAAETRGKHLGRPSIPKRVIGEIEALATTTTLSIRQIQSKIAGRASRRDHKTSTRTAANCVVTTFYTYPELTPIWFSSRACQARNRLPSTSSPTNCKHSAAA
jgi:DNA invertase Pin-like site-specific DNA recombinase